MWIVLTAAAAYSTAAVSTDLPLHTEVYHQNGPEGSGEREAENGKGGDKARAQGKKHGSIEEE